MLRVVRRMQQVAQLRQLATVSIVMPKLDADTIEDGTVASLLKNVGDSVHADDTVAEVETDKVMVEVQAQETGVITKVLVAEGDEVRIGQEMFELDTEGKVTPESKQTASSSSPSSSTPTKPESKPSPLTPKQAPSSPAQSSNKPGHVPLIQFRHGKRSTPSSSSASSQSEGAAGYWQPPESKADVDFLDLPPAFGRPVLSLEEMDAINSGGASQYN